MVAKPKLKDKSIYYLSPQSTLSAQSHQTWTGSKSCPWGQILCSPTPSKQCQYFLQLNSSANLGRKNQIEFFLSKKKLLINILNNQSNHFKINQSIHLKINPLYNKSIYIINQFTYFRSIHMIIYQFFLIINQSTKWSI